MLDHLIAFLRATLGASRAAAHPLATEFERLRRLPGADGRAHGAAAAGARWTCPTALRAHAGAAAAAAAAGGKQPSSTGWSRRSRAAASRSRRAREGDRCCVLTVRDTGVGLAEQRPRPAAASAWSRCASAWPRCTAAAAALTLATPRPARGGDQLATVHPAADAAMNTPPPP